MNFITILGCGWFGLPLAKSLLSKGYNVKGSTTSATKLKTLKEAEIMPFQIQLNEQEIIGNVSDFLHETDVLIIAIPPGLRKEILSSEEMTFINKMKILIPYIEKAGIQKVLFVSSTSVYGDRFPIVEYTESTQNHPDTESGRQLVLSEKLLQSNIHFKTTVIRFGGLLGEDRHPIKFLAGRTQIENPDGPVNLIQREDCIGIIIKALDFAYKDKWGETFNAVAPQHPTRKNYYQKKAQQFNFPLPNFVEDTKSKGKIISSKKVETILDYSFQKEIW
ncbi:NAD-dependent epimerase/dehydratase family protein [Flavobacterium sp.]|jgi:nucleoside-diphosphate-sugar epimerase|uniref:NAD-dependent epimerase/dehydratase family protein n=1 Tax=Flavobacterium sp. TaxID=239 RepID=UPI0037BF1945